MDDDESEPYLPEGLAPFSPAQQALAEFLEVDEDLLNGAGLDRPLVTHQVAEEDIDSWLASLEVAELRGWVKQLLTGQVQEAVRGVQNRFIAGVKETDDGRNDGYSRTAGDLWELAERAGEIRQQEEKAQQERDHARRREIRNQQLKSLAGDFSRAWRAVQRKAEVGSGKAYDEACLAVVELKEAYLIHATGREFDAALRAFLEKNRQRKTLMQRLVTAGVVKG